jgi:prepilin-type N-terminal cleavage/methylation domain-containing protein
MRKNIYKNPKGFSLIETLIAVSILMIAIAGPLSLVQAGLFSSIHQRNQVTATYLAQEALEYIKGVRDANSYTQYGGSNLNWLTGPDSSSLLHNSSNSGLCDGSDGCYVDPHGKLPGGVFVWKVSSVKKLTASTVGAFRYSYETGGTFIDSPYTRTVFISSVGNNGDEVKVTVKIDWNDNALARSYTVSENIYNYE